MNRSFLKDESESLCTKRTKRAICSFKKSKRAMRFFVKRFAWKTEFPTLQLCTVLSPLKMHWCITPKDISKCWLRSLTTAISKYCRSFPLWKVPKSVRWGLFFPHSVSEFVGWGPKRSCPQIMEAITPGFWAIIYCIQDLQNVEFWLLVSKSSYR